MSGLVAAGHPLTAEAGAAILRDGGNAVDAAIASVLTSFAVESPLTGLGAGGHLLVHDPRRPGGAELIDFFVAASGKGAQARPADLEPVEVHFDVGNTQVFNVGAASCGVPGTPAGLAFAWERYGTVPMPELARSAVALARGGAPLNHQQAYILGILAPIYIATEQLRRVYAPEGRVLRAGESLRFPELAEALERFAEEGPAAFYTGDIGAALSEHVLGLGGGLTAEDLGSYEPAVRRPISAGYRGCEVLTNPPPSAGGILIAYCLELLERETRGGGRAPGPEEAGVEALVEVMCRASEERDAEFMKDLFGAGFAGRFLDPARLDAVAASGSGGGGGGRLGSTTHIVAVDSEGMCASVTCSNGTGSGVLVPGTGVHLNNMMGEQDLNPLGFGRSDPGARMPSMMSPTLVLRDGELIAGLGSAGSNRIRSAILQTVVNLVGREMDVREAVEAPRVHFEAGLIEAEPGIDPAALGRLERRGYPVVRWRGPNLFFGGVQAVARSAGAAGAVVRPDGRLGAAGSGGWLAAGDSRRGGSVAAA